MPSFDRQSIQTELQKIWGYQDFRAPQAEIINSLLTGQDALIVMPTGGGKSICFQLPALLQTGLTLIVSPLVALMENQVARLHQKNLPAALIHSELSRWQKKQTLQALARQELRLVYLSPETLLSSPIWEIISQPQIKINGLVLDEAHCLVQWGTTFRPAYTRLGIVRPSLLKDKPQGTQIAIAAFTATADPLTQKTITQKLQLDRPQVFLINPYRPNLNLQVKTIWTPRGRKQQALKFIQTKKNQAGLVYVRSRRDSEELAQWFGAIGYAVKAYHAGLPTTARRTIEQDWLTGKVQFTVCTSAFGMGIDKSDVRWIVHFHAPELLSEYLQEVGRGGRDGKPADALTLISEPTGWFNPEDKQRSQFFTQKLAKQYLQAKQLIKQIPPQGNINAIARQFPGGDLALSLLYSVGLVKWQDPFTYQKKSTHFKLNQSDRIQQAWQKQRHAFLQTKQCRWQFLLAAFGFNTEAKGFSCGHCDNCLRV
jgi:ATP-dependent DNA helicase RecQ